MSTQLNPYLSFRDNAKSAMEFYQSVFGGELTMSTFDEFNMSQSPDDKDKIMHAQLVAPNGLVLMGADTPAGMDYSVGTNFSVSLSGDDEGQLRGYWDKLSDGGMVTMPLEPAPWGDTFGMCVDKFGVNWMVDVLGQQQS